MRTFPLSCIVLFGLVSIGFSQPSPPPLQMQTPAATQAAASPAGEQNMDKMASTVTRAAEMCEMMMKKEMAGAPYKMAAGVGIGALLLIALVLFVILEVQWIIYWSRLLKAQKREHRP